MGSSRGFGSATCHWSPSSDSLSLWHRGGTTSPKRDRQQLAGSFFNRHAIRPRARLPARLCPLTARQQTVSGSVSLPARGVFSPFPHGTVRYRSLWLFSLGTWSSPLPTGFHVPGGTHETSPRSVAVAYRALTVSGGPSQGPSASNRSAHSVETRSGLPNARPTPPRHRPTRHSVALV
jgi:hypothetical protein